MSQPFPTIEVFNADNFFIFAKNDSSLWWDKTTGTFYAKRVKELPFATPPLCIGTCQGIVGKVQLPGVLEPKLIVIKQSTEIGRGIFKIKTISFLQPTGSEAVPPLNICEKHQHFSALGRDETSRVSPLAKTFGGVMRSAQNTIKTSTQQCAKIINRDNKLEKRIMDELNKIFNDTDSFYFSPSQDLTNSLQRRSKHGKNEMLWKNVDERFFWNRHMVEDILKLSWPQCDPWILPIIQGFVAMTRCLVEVGFDLPASDTTTPRFVEVDLTVISRRSRHRAGTRYKRRGVDEAGHCANYVETEQILGYEHHLISFVQTRGSVPVFWAQPGYKYRPPPMLLKGPAETQEVFNKHFAHEQGVYGPVCVVNLVEQAGKERVIWEAYTNHMLALNDPNVTYCSFDFHEYCRGMRFENVSYLIESLTDVMRTMGYCWADTAGAICEQRGVFRVNCIDCLDRTNVVQTAIAKSMLELQLTKLGLLPPEGQLSADMRCTFQKLWADSGDVVSRQYAGTNALKGDFTRTGERKLTGLMKDGMNSANRYYRVHLRDGYRQLAIDLAQGIPPEPVDFLNELEARSREVVGAVIPEKAPRVNDIMHVALEPEMRLLRVVCLTGRYYLSRFKDSHRQATIDIMLGHEVSEDVFSDKATDDDDGAATAVHVKSLLDDCKKLLINDPTEVLGCWGLIDADPETGDPSETEMDTILILTKYAYYVAEYDDQVDRVSKYQRVALRDIRHIEVGTSGVSAPLSMFKKQTGPHCLRIHYSIEGVAGYFHTFRSTSLRFFNNVAVQINTSEEMLESLKAIHTTYLAALKLAELPQVPVTIGESLERMKSKTLTAENTCRIGNYLEIRTNMTRNASETQLTNLKTAGSKALSNISQQFSKMGRLGQSFRPGRNRPRPTPPIRQPPSVSVHPVDESETSPGSASNSSSGSVLSDDALSNLLSKHWHLPSVGVLMTDAPRTSAITILNRSPLHHAKTQGTFDPAVLSECRRRAQQMAKDKLLSPVPSRRVLSTSAENFEQATDRIPVPATLNLNLPQRSMSEKDLTLNLASSQSESALKSITSNIVNVMASPAHATKDILSPLSKFATSLGSTLDPRKTKGEHSYRTSEYHQHEVQDLQDRWSGCSVKLIAL